MQAGTKLNFHLGFAVAASTTNPAKSFESWFHVEKPQTLPIESVQKVVDSPQGGFVARHTHGGPLYSILTQNSVSLSSRFQSRMRLDSTPAHYRVHLLVLTYEPGAWTTLIRVSAPRLLAVVSGEVTILRSASAKDAIESWRLLGSRDQGGVSCLRKRCK